MKKKPKQRSKIIENACEEAGGMRALGRAMGIPYQSIQAWKEIPAQHILTIERVTGIPREQLRPELYTRKKT